MKTESVQNIHPDFFDESISRVKVYLPPDKQTPEPLIEEPVIESSKRVRIVPFPLKKGACHTKNSKTATGRAAKLSLIALIPFTAILFSLTSRPPLKAVSSDTIDIEEFEETKENLAKLTSVVAFLLEHSKESLTQWQPEAKPEILHGREMAHVITVTKERAMLRAAPDTGSKAIMSLSSGSKLIAQEQANDWYRVISPKGEVAWISKSLVK